MVLVRIQYVFSVSLYHSARGDMQKYLPIKVAPASKPHQCWGTGAGVSPLVAGVQGTLRVSEEGWGDQVMGALVREV